ncbi:biotin-dependent carboxyltransferase family protein [Nocardioides sp. SYSU DS0651]|uniref:5-oxoprolinase subunit C family protein n=1 Tax=Nocardioides sp. SYSU DS0651 TaxID=3415955 RepID=UPI003F4C01D2
MSALLVRAVGGPCLVQDAGRPGHAAIGVGSSGAADLASYGLGNRLLGNAPGAAALEILLGGLEVEAAATAWVCVTGAPAAVAVDGRREPTGAVLALRPGQRLTVGMPATGLRCYVAVRGGLAVPPVLGSRSRDTLSGIGPPPVAVGDRLPVGDAVAGDMLVDSVPPRAYDARPVLRVVRGPRDDWVADADRLVGATWRVGAASDRVGLRLEGARLTVDPARGQLPSEGALRGAVQVPPSGEPVLFGPDHPVTGGYPVIGVVVAADTDRLAQLRPGDQVRFAWTHEVAGFGARGGTTR